LADAVAPEIEFRDCEDVIFKAKRPDGKIGIAPSAQGIEYNRVLVIKQEHAF
jgi:hypothetical protein